MVILPDGTQGYISILHRQYRGCWWTVGARVHILNNQVIDLVWFETLRCWLWRPCNEKGQTLQSMDIIFSCWRQYIPRNMHTVFALLCFVVVIHWLIIPYPSGLLHWHCGNLAIAPVPAKQPWWIWINTSCEFIMNDCITTTKQSTTKPCAYFLGYTLCW